MPEVIPSLISKRYSDAIVADQSGQTLAGIFLLRVLIEQWVKPLAVADEKVDQLLNRYLADLPIDFKSRFPSLSDVYSDLSAAMHSANADAGLFDRARADIVTHFDARRLFNLGDIPKRPSESKVEGAATLG